MAYYRLFVPKQAVGASKIYFDLFNTTGSGFQLYLETLIPVISGAVAITGSVAVDVFLNRTTAIGVAGTDATFEGTSLTACTITDQDGSGNIVGRVSARLTPSSGATGGAILSWRSVFSEETNGATYMPMKDMVRNGVPGAPPVVISPGTGISVIQGSVASAGNLGFDASFRLVPRA